MAKQNRTLPARARGGADDTLLVRSAESLGRMIGSLQRQLDGVSKKLPASMNAAALMGMDGRENGNRKRPAARKSGGTKKTASAARASTGASKSGVKKVQSTADRASKRASKSAGAKKTAGRSRSGASRKAAKTSRRSS